MQPRKKCRNHYRELRDNMSYEEVLVKSDAICKRVLESAEYKVAETILAYYPIGKEVQCLPVIVDALESGKRVFLPRTERQGQMDFFQIHSLDEVEEGAFHVMEPKAFCKKFESQNLLEENGKIIIALVPGVVFDRNGNRYGYGKGYYDRYFARFPHLRRIALAYTTQLSETALECLDTDVKMHSILTDSERIDIKFNDIGEKNGVIRNL